MVRPIIIKDLDGKDILVNEDNICTVRPVGGWHPDRVIIKMNDGETICSDTWSWNNWENDVFLRREK